MAIKSGFFLGKHINIKPSVFIARKNISDADHLVLNEENSNIKALYKQYVVSLNILQQIFAASDEYSLDFILFYFNSVQNQKNRNVIKRLGRKRKKFKELKGKSNITKRRREIDENFLTSHSININEYVLSQNLNFISQLPNYVEIKNFIYKKKMILVWYCSNYLSKR